MHARQIPLHRKHLTDPAACGVRLGIELREAAELEAYSSGMCLSHWIKGVVQEALSKSSVENQNKNADELQHKPNNKENKELDEAYRLEMEKLNVR